MLRASAKALAVLAFIPALCPALTPEAAQQFYDRVRQSLVAVQYTYNGELGRREFIGSGIVVSEDGLVMAPMAMFPVQIPDAQMIEFKVIVPGDEGVECDAVFQGRDERSDVVFVKTKKPQKWKPIKFEDVQMKVGDAIITVGLLPKQAGYHPYFTQAMVSAVLRGPVPQVLVSPGGLAIMGSPVFNEAGQAVGLVNAQIDQPVLLNDPQSPLGTVTTPPRLFVPTRDFMQSLNDPPTPEHPLQLPWMGLVQIIGLKKDVADYYGLDRQPAVQIGDVIPGFAAANAGIKPGMIIVKMNGQALERGDEPDEAAQILTRKIRRLKVGTPVTFTVLTEKGKPLQDITLTLQNRPKQANEADRFYSDDLGFSAREIVFEDLYERHLPFDTQGVLVALIKPGSAAQNARLTTGDLVTRLNQTPVTDLNQFKKLYQDFRKANPREGVVIEVLRGVDTQVIRIEPPQ